MSIHERSATVLLRRMEARELSSEEIVTALDGRIKAVNERLNAFVLREPAAVLGEARRADEERRAGRLRGPLHGLPVTIKDNVDVAGTDSTLGMAARRDRPAAKDAAAVSLLKEAGAILLGKTNVPQLLLAQETENATFGVTRNPWNLDRVPGGSSGGEAAAIASGCSAAGIGTDIGGSIRMPAHFCGIAGLKPTLDRISNRGSQGAIPGQEIVRAQLGPLARSTEDLALLMRVLSPEACAAMDPAVPPLPLGDPSKVSLRGLRVGFFDDDGFLTPARCIKRAVAEAREALEAAGAELVPYSPPSSEEIIYLWLGAISADGGRTIDAQLRGEEISPQLKPSRTTLAMPALARKALAQVLGMSGERRLAKLLGVLGEKKVDKVWALTARRTVLRLIEHDAWNAAAIDAMICPPHVIPALPHRASGDFTLSLSYAFRWSLLNFPAGIVPVTRVRPDETQETRHGKLDKVEKKLLSILQGSAGLPLGVQVVARPYREDLVLALMAAIEAHAIGREGFPKTPVDP
ncbi:MAG: amidase family protein [Polyangia bacterium]|jgi:fatty acid amide hydrolase|nr:amidase family protein [Polyangia bacterium]